MIYKYTRPCDSKGQEKSILQIFLFQAIEMINLWQDIF